MDIRMPVVDGLEATRRILAADDSVRVLVLTTFDLDEYVYEALRAGASGFVLKDDPPEQLIAAVRTIAAGEALLSPTVTRRVIQQFTRLHQQAPPKAVTSLTSRELDVFRLITRGLSHAEIDEHPDGHEPSPVEVPRPSSRTTTRTSRGPYSTSTSAWRAWARASRPCFEANSRRRLTWSTYFSLSAPTSYQGRTAQHATVREGKPAEGTGAANTSSSSEGGRELRARAT
jgi:FixJ family two-component response regulator